MKEEMEKSVVRLTKIQDEAIKDKDALTNLELKVEELETDNLNKDMKLKEVEMESKSLHIQLDSLKVKTA
jgi:hypothetical protein